MNQQGDPPKTRLFLWEDCGLYAGLEACSKLHSHHAIQITYVLDGECRIRAQGDGQWRTTTGFLILPGTVYQGDTPGRFVTFFVDVNHPLYWRHKCAQESVFLHGIRCFDVHAEDLHRLREFHGGRISCPQARGLFQDAVVRWFPESLGTPALDTRIGRIVAHIDHALPGAMKLEDIAAVVGLSPSRVMHLFRAETGTTVRQFILWRRLKSVLVTLAKGENLTHSAHVAGFSDSAHLTRTFVMMFGFSPTAILAGPVGAQFAVCSETD